MPHCHFRATGVASSEVDFEQRYVNNALAVRLVERAVFRARVKATRVFKLTPHECLNGISRQHLYKSGSLTIFTSSEYDCVNSMSPAFV